MKSILVLFAFFSASLSVAGTTMNLKKSIQLSNQLEKDFSEFHSWTSRCTTEIFIRDLSCTAEDTGGKFDLLTCVGTSMTIAGEIKSVTVLDPIDLISAMRKSGVPAFQNKLTVKNLNCASTFTGYAGCGTGRNTTECSLDSVHAE